MEIQWAFCLSGIAVPGVDPPSTYIAGARTRIENKSALNTAGHHVKVPVIWGTFDLQNFCRTCRRYKKLDYITEYL